MSQDNMKNLRNIGIIAHIDAGKTTLSERILFYTRKIHRMGEVHDGTATMDFMPEEQERGITIAAAASTCRWKDWTLNLIDTPGHVDFTIEVERSLRVLDGAVGVFCAVGGVEPQSETVWRQSEAFGVPKIAFVNKMDRVGANFSAVLDALHDRLGATPAAVTVPLGEGPEFHAVADVVSLKKLIFDEDSQGQSMEELPLEGEEKDLALLWREKTLETLGENDDTFMERYLEESFTEEDIHEAIKRATLARKVTPVFAGSALKNAGVQPLLDAVGRYLPSPLDVPAPRGSSVDGTKEKELDISPKAPFCGLVFKVLMEGGRKTSLIRIYAGSLKEGDVVRNTAQKKDERVSRMFRMDADQQEQLAEASSGDIVAVLGLKSARTGDTVAAPGLDILLENLESVKPVISMALEPRNADEGKTLDEALSRYSAEDPTLGVTQDEDSGDRIISGMGELHLDVVLERMRREYGISPRAGQPQVVARETVRAEGEGHGLFDRDLGTVHHFGEVVLTMAPAGRDAGNRVELAEALAHPADVKEALPKALVDEVLQGISDSLLSGPQTGYPVQDVLVTVTAIRKENATAAGCRMAASMAVRDAMEKARACVLEPIMDVEIVAPEEALGSSISLFQNCGGKVEELGERGGMRYLSGIAPMRRLFGFSTALRSATQGRAGFTLRFRHYDSM
ncbi:elongation factor G [Mailhella massiliensis]|uniref:Elongation factor G n=1 Tax=Mailhella massiliensis TaxID=1903261 RepID=A0A921DSC0_9BACT|nr:elongation factor G [Mailhella massiliensis]HJD98404.1 elongation factor G [Mailhella massiliensis]